MLSLAIGRTLAYGDIFDYPLTLEELHRFLISSKPVDLTDLKKALAHLDGVEKESQFYLLKGQRGLVAIRRKRQRWSQKKIKIARRTAFWLRLIPWIKLVGITGALAMNNSDEEDDIDFLIITARNRLWLTRLLTVLLIEIVAKRRRPSDSPGKQIKDKICLNMFLDEAHLKIPKKEQNLFTAHEVCQLKMLWERKNTYQKFIRRNQWTKEFLANWKP